MFSRVSALLMCVLAAAPANAAQKIAIFPFDIRDQAQAEEIVPETNPEDRRRLELIAGELASLMKASGAYEVADLSPVAADVQQAAPFNECDGCETVIAGKVGADTSVTGFVDKVSDALMSLQLYFRDVKTGQMKKAMSAEIRGNTDELWLHGIRWLWRNRIQEPKQP